MRFAGLISGAVLSVMATIAAAENRGFFAGLDALGGVAFGSSSTKNGGGLPPMFNGDGVVGNVRFGATSGVGGHAGYRFTPSWAALLSYQHLRGDIGWNATFATSGMVAEFDGVATSDVLIGSLAYERSVSAATALRLTAGLGVTFNRLSQIVETNKAGGEFISNVAGNTMVSPAAQIGAGVRHNLTDNATIGLDALLAYSGGFETGATRQGNLGVTDINPYRIDNVWRMNLGASVRFEF